MDYFRVSPTAYFVPVSVKIPGLGGRARRRKGGGETRFDFVGQIQDEQASVVGNVRDFIKVKLDRGQCRAAWRSRSFHYDAGFTLAPGSTG